MNNGWKWAGTREIDQNGHCIDKDYYEGLDGGGPSQYYFGKDINTLKVIGYLGVLGDGTNIYGYSIYRKMSDEELSECRKNYPTNFEDVWN